MNKDDTELFGLVKKTEHPKAEFVMKLVKVGFKYDSICKKLEPLLDGKCRTVGAYAIPDCSGYELIWASSKTVTSVRKVISKELKTYIKMADTMEGCDDVDEVHYKGQELLVMKSIPYSFLMSYVIVDVYESHGKKLSRIKDFSEMMTVILKDLDRGHTNKWSDGMSYRDFFKFLDKRVAKFKSKHLCYLMD